MQVQSQQMPGDMSIGGLTAAGEAVQQPLSEPEQRLLDMSARREAVAMQFYFLYRLHGCWCSWWQQAAAGTLQRLREEQDRTLAEQHARVRHAAGCFWTGTRSTVQCTVDCSYTDANHPRSVAR